MHLVPHFWEWVVNVQTSLIRCPIRGTAPVIDNADYLSDCVNKVGLDYVFKSSLNSQHNQWGLYSQLQSLF